MNNKLDKEQKEFLAMFSEEASKPSLKFKSKLKSQVIKEYKGGNAWNLFVPFGLAFTALGVFTFAVLLFRTVEVQNVKIKEVNVLQTNESKDILSKVIKSNPENIINKASTKQTTTKPNEVEQIKQSSKSIVNNSSVKNYQYTYNKTTTEKGLEFESCIDSKSYDESVLQKTESFNLIESKSKIYYKSVTYSQNGIIDYLSTETTGNNIETIIYKGGEYAVKISDELNTEKPISYPLQNTVSYPPVNNVSYPVSYSLVDDLSNQYFDESVEVKEIEKEGKSYYALVKEVRVLCKGSTAVLLYNTVVDKISYKIASIEVYKNNLQEKSLIYRINTSNNDKSATLEEFKNEFKPEFNAPVRDYEELERYDLGKYILDNEILGVIPETDFKLSAIKSIQYNLDREYKFNADKKFYSSSTEGEQSLLDFISANNLKTINNLLEAQYSDESRGYRVEVFYDEVSNQVILESIPTLKKIDQGSLAVLLDQTQALPLFYGVESQNCVQDINCPDTAFILFFNSGNYKTAIFFDQTWTLNQIDDVTYSLKGSDYLSSIAK